MKFTQYAAAVLSISAAMLAGCGGGDTTAAASSTSTSSGDPAGCTTLTYSASAGVAGNPHTNGAKVCFLGDTTKLQFNGKTLTNPTQNTAVTAPFSAYTFLDGTIKYEPIYKNGAFYEINVFAGNSSPFYGQFAP